MTCVAYDIEPSKTLYYLKIGTSSKVIPVLTRRNIDGAVAVVYKFVGKVAGRARVGPQQQQFDPISKLFDMGPS